MKFYVGVLRYQLQLPLALCWLPPPHWPLALVVGTVEVKASVWQAPLSHRLPRDRGVFWWRANLSAFGLSSLPMLIRSNFSGCLAFGHPCYVVFPRPILHCLGSLPRCVQLLGW